MQLSPHSLGQADDRLRVNGACRPRLLGSWHATSRLQDSSELPPTGTRVARAPPRDRAPTTAHQRRPGSERRSGSCSRRTPPAGLAWRCQEPLSGSASWSPCDVVASGPDCCDRVSDRRACTFHEFRLLLHQIGELAEDRRRCTERGCLLAECAHSLFDELVRRARRRDRAADKLALELELALEDSLKQLGLVLQRAGLNRSPAQPDQTQPRQPRRRRPGSRPAKRSTDQPDRPWSLPRFAVEPAS